MSKLNRKSVPLSLESLEERCVPATYYWHPQGGSVNYSLAGNWYSSSGLQTMVIPGTNDTAVFGGTYGTNSNCTIDDNTTVGVLSLQSTTAYTATLTLDVTYQVGTNDTSGATGSDWKSGSIEFATGSGYSAPELDIYTPYNSTNKGFRFDGGNVGESGSYTGRVDVFAGSVLSFGFSQADVHWGAILWTQATSGLNPAGETDFITGGSGQLKWDYTGRSGSEPGISNYGKTYFMATDASSTISGIKITSNPNPSASRFFNVGLVVFQGGSTENHEDLPFQNGDNSTAGNLKIYDDTKAIFGGTYSDAAYGNTDYFQMNSGSFAEIYCGTIRNGGNMAVTAGSFQYGNQASYTNHTVINTFTGANFTFYLDGALLESDINGGSTTLAFSNMSINIGLNNPSTSIVTFDFDVSSGTIYGKITCDKDLTVGGSGFSRPTFGVNVSGGTPPSATYDLFTYTSLTESLTPYSSFTGSFTLWTGGAPGATKLSVGC